MKVAWSCPTLCDPMDLYSPWNSPGQDTGVGSLSFLQGIFSTQELNPGLPHCRWILYQLSHKESPRILDWVTYPCSSGSSRPRNQTRVSFIAGRFFHQLNSQGSVLDNHSISHLSSDHWKKKKYSKSGKQFLVASILLRFTYQQT